MGDGIPEMISVCIPVYNGAQTIKETIQSVLSQTLKDIECVVVDNASSDQTVDVVRSIIDPRIRMFRNDKNIGCGGNLEECKKKAQGDILFYISADDIAAPNSLEKVSAAFALDERIGIVTRPYYWFETDVHRPVRATRQFKEQQVVSITDGFEKVLSVLALSDQISGMAFRKIYMKAGFGQDYFVEMSTQVASMLKECRAVILKENIVAVRIADNGAMKPYVYEKSPMMCWYDMIIKAYDGEVFRPLKDHLIRNFIANNFIGLVQIKNFSGYLALFREIGLLIKLNWLNIFKPTFWFFSLGTIIIPRTILWKMVVFYKNKINSAFLKNIKLGE